MLYVDRYTKDKAHRARLSHTTLVAHCASRRGARLAADRFAFLHSLIIQAETPDINRYRFIAVQYPHQCATSQRIGVGSAAAAATFGFTRLTDPAYEPSREKAEADFREVITADGAGVVDLGSLGLGGSGTWRGGKENIKPQGVKDKEKFIREQTIENIRNELGEEEVKKLETNTKDYTKVYVKDRDVPLVLLDDLIVDWGIDAKIEEERKKKAAAGKCGDGRLVYLAKVKRTIREMLRTFEGRVKREK